MLIERSVMFIHLHSKIYHKVRYHCHFTGKYEGAAFSIFNLTNKIPRKVSKDFHNGLNYRYHLSWKN